MIYECKMQQNEAKVDIYRPTILWSTFGMPLKPSGRRACHVRYKGSKSQGVQIATSFRCKILVFLFLYGFGRAPLYQIQFLTTRQLAGWVPYVFNMLVRCFVSVIVQTKENNAIFTNQPECTLLKGSLYFGIAGKGVSETTYLPCNQHFDRIVQTQSQIKNF